MEILKTDFGIKITKELEDMVTYDDYRYSESSMEGRIENMIQVYNNMKKDNFKDKYICSILGITLYKLRQIKKMARETAVSQNNM